MSANCEMHVSREMNASREKRVTRVERRERLGATIGGSTRAPRRWLHISEHRLGCQQGSVSHYAVRLSLQAELQV